MHVEIFHTCWVKLSTFNFSSFYFNVAPGNILIMCVAHPLFLSRSTERGSGARLCKPALRSHRLRGAVLRGGWPQPQLTLG